MPLLLAFIVVPLIEIGLFIQVGGAIGIWSTLAIVLVTAIVGASMVRRQGADVMKQLQGSFQTFQDPSKTLAEGAMILFSGALLLTPGFFTDVVGFALLIPGVRGAIFARVGDKMKMSRATGSRANVHTPDDIVEGDFVVKDETANSSQTPSGWRRD